MVLIQQNYLNKRQAVERMFHKDINFLDQDSLTRGFSLFSV